MKHQVLHVSRLAPAVFVYLAMIMEPVSAQNLVVPDYMRGNVNHAPLADLATGNIQQCCEMMQRDLKKSRIQLEAAYKQYPDDLVAYTALLQLDTSRFDADIPKLTNDKTAHGLYKLGAIYFYRYVLGSNGHIAKSAIDSQRESIALLDRAWAKSHESIIGLFNLQVIRSFTTFHLSTGLPIWKTLIHDLAGPKAYAQYEHASNLGWHTAPPSKGLIHVENRHPLRAVLIDIQKQCNASSKLTLVQNGKKTITAYNPTDDDKRQYKYLGLWIQSL